MRELVIISGKGGTGKTTLTAAFASLAEEVVLCDADVDAADLHLLMDPRIESRTDFMGGYLASINRELCTECGICRAMCSFEAISETFETSRIDCEGCGLCVDFCPEEAIDFVEKKCGEWFISETRFGKMVHARLGIAEENSGKLVALVRQEAKKLARSNGMELIITDGPPGIGCPVIASIGDSTAILIVVEPTVSGIHDMERVVQLAKRFGIPAMVLINKYDLNLEQSERIETYAAGNDVRFMGRVGYDPVFTKSMVQGQTIFEYASGSDAAEAVREIWDGIMKAPEMNQLRHYEFNFE